MCQIYSKPKVGVFLRQCIVVHADVGWRRPFLCPSNTVEALVKLPRGPHPSLICNLLMKEDMLQFLCWLSDVSTENVNIDRILHRSTKENSS